MMQPVSAPAKDRVALEAEMQTESEQYGAARIANYKLGNHPKTVAALNGRHCRRCS